MSMATFKVVLGLVTSLLESLFDTLTPPFLKNLRFLFSVEGEAQKLNSVLTRIQALLNDAEDKQIREESFCLWLRELNDAAYNAEDILDELECLVLRSKKEEAPMQTRNRKWTEQVSDLLSRFISYLDVGPRILEIRERLEEIESRSNYCYLNVIRESKRLIPLKRHQTSSIIEESTVFGRDTDRETVVDLLTSDDGSGSSIQFVAICGMGGVGKTTLAQLIYNDRRVRDHFDVKAWVYVSGEDFDLIRLTKAIAEEVDVPTRPDMTLNKIQGSIQEALRPKMFLLVLDDVWNDNSDDWEALRAPLMAGLSGSKILITTRNRSVSSCMGTISTYILRGLFYDDCWTLFRNRAFVGRSSEAPPRLAEIGKEIIKKCEGLPLAVKTLGNLLRRKLDVGEWNAILGSEILDLPEENNYILPVLRLSYDHLPAHLKRCFAYCGCIFHKGSHINGKEVVRLWMAQGFIQPRGSFQMEDIGREYLTALVERSLLNLSPPVFTQLTYTMDDLTHDLARFVLQNDFLETRDGKWHKKVRNVQCHLSESIVESFKIEDFYSLKSVRTLPIVSHRNIPADLFVNLRHIRTLRLIGNHHITELPESIGNLLQLRCLDLSSSSIERLPESTTKLYHLQTMKLEYCNMLVELPSDFGNLVNLRSLYISSCPLLQERYQQGGEHWCKISHIPDISIE